MNCPVLLASLAVVTLMQPQERSFHCVGEDRRGQLVTVDGNLIVDPNVPSPHRFTIGSVAVEAPNGQEPVTLHPAGTVIADFSATAMDLELRKTGSIVYVRTGPTGRVGISVRRHWLESTDYVGHCRFQNGRSLAVERLAK